MRILQLFLKLSKSNNDLLLCSTFIEKVEQFRNILMFLYATKLRKNTCCYKKEYKRPTNIKK